MKKLFFVGVWMVLGLVGYGQEDRKVWLGYLDRVARPVLSALAEDRLKEVMPVVLSKRIDDAVGRSKVTYLEAWGRLLSGIGPWLNGEGGTKEEVALRALYREWAVKAVRNSVDPGARDYMVWSGGQPLVDASFFALGLVRCPWLWEHLDSKVKGQVVEALKVTRGTVPAYSNWILFSAMVETFFCKYGMEYDKVRIEYGLREFFEHWYLGDGTFSDGMAYHDDYYNSYVIQPYLMEILGVVGRGDAASGGRYERYAERMEKIARRYAEIQERAVNADGSFNATGRSITYRCGAFHQLGEAVLKGEVSSALGLGQVRGALTAVMKRTLGASGTFTEKGWLAIGLNGHQEDLADSYITGGSLYLCSEVFLPLGLSGEDGFWTAPAAPWTAVKVWSGMDSTRADHALDVVDVRPYRLVWADEFNKDGRPDGANWGYEHGFVRNHEAQFYQEENAWCEGGKLIIEARKKEGKYTSASLLTKGLHSWKYGRFEMRAKIDVQSGMWPAFWTLGEKGEWPSNGEIDIMEYYRGMLLANIATGTDKQYKAFWFSKRVPVDSLGGGPGRGAVWAAAWHVWRMDWDEERIRLSVDDKVLQEVSMRELENRDGKGVNPFKQPHYIILNLALGGDNGGDLTKTAFPRRFEVDYVRVYQRE